MATLTVRRTGNSLAVPLPSPLVRELGLRPGDRVMIRLDVVPEFLDFEGLLKGVLTADEFTKLSNEGELVD